MPTIDCSLAIRLMFVLACALHSPLPAHSQEPVAECVVQGRLTLPNGAAAAGARIQLRCNVGRSELEQRYGLPSAWQNPPEVVIDGTGCFELRFFPPRAFRLDLDARLDEYPRFGLRWASIEPGATLDLGAVAFDPPCFIEGHVEASDGELLVANWSVFGDPQHPRDGRRHHSRVTATIDATTGSFRLGPFPPGPVRLTAASPSDVRIEGPTVVARPDAPVQVVLGDTSARASFPKPASKKGLQVQMIDDALALGVQHAGLNVLLGDLVDADARAGALVWKHGELTLHLRPERIAVLDRAVAPLTAAGVVVSFILLGGVTGDPRVDDALLHPARPRTPPNGLAAFDGEDSARTATLAALIDFLAARYDGGVNGRVWGWIVGNEVNSHGAWYAMGDATPEVVARRYEAAVRVVYDAVTARSVNARVYVSLEHHFASAFQPDRPLRSLPGRELLERFALRARERGDFPWHVAFHPYPEDLFDASFWDDTTAPRCPAPPRITFRNLRELERFLARHALCFAGAPRRVILSEQGFHRREGAAGELLQAAAYAAAYQLVEACPTIDAFLLHRHVDHAHEGGLQLGLWSRRADSVADPERATRMRAVFSAIDRPGADEALAFALPIVGATSWVEFVRDTLDSREVHPELAHIASLRPSGGPAARTELSLLGLAPSSLLWTPPESLPQLVAARAMTRSGEELRAEVALDPTDGAVLRLVLPGVAGGERREWRPE